MATSRRLALKLLNAVVRLASPAAQDWAKAMLRELDFIENDWTALLWALGSTRILLKRGDVPVADLSDIPRVAQSLTKRIRRRTLGGCLITLGETVAFGWFVFIVPNTMQRLGCCLTVAAMLYMTYQLVARRTREAPSETDPSVCAISYRAELERQRDFHRGWWFWSRLLIMLPGMLLFCLGGAIAQPETIQVYLAIVACFIALAIAAIPLNLRLARKYQRQINELDTVRRGPQ